VIALSRDAGKRKRLEEVAALRTVDPGGEDPVAAVRDGPDRDGVDLVLDMVGAAAWDLNLRVLRPRGRMVLVGLLGGSRIEADLSVLLSKRLTVTGTVLRSRSLEEKAALTLEFRRNAAPLLEEGRVRPVVDRVLPLERAPEAHAAVERNEHFGKIVLRVR
jgi:NADPH:quinone reductase-like Zn-dependent oxidoreductase